MSNFSPSLLPLLLYEEARYTFDETRSMESTKAVTRFDNQRYIFNQECFIDRAHAGKRIFERITCREGGFRRLEFRFQPRATRPQSRVICDDLEPVKVN